MVGRARGFKRKAFFGQLFRVHILYQRVLRRQLVFEHTLDGHRLHRLSTKQLDQQAPKGVDVGCKSWPNFGCCVVQDWELRVVQMYRTVELLETNAQVDLRQSL